MSWKYLDCEECGERRRVDSSQESKVCEKCRKWLAHRDELRTWSIEARLERVERLLFEYKPSVSVSDVYFK